MEKIQSLNPNNFETPQKAKIWKIFFVFIYLWLHYLNDGIVHDGAANDAWGCTRMPRTFPGPEVAAPSRCPSHDRRSCIASACARVRWTRDWTRPASWWRATCRSLHATPRRCATAFRRRQVDAKAPFPPAEDIEGTERERWHSRPLTRREPVFQNRWGYSCVPLFAVSVIHRYEGFAKADLLHVYFSLLIVD